MSFGISDNEVGQVGNQKLRIDIDCVLNKAVKEKQPLLSQARSH